MRSIFASCCLVLSIILSGRPAPSCCAKNAPSHPFIASQKAYWQYLHYACFLAPVGFIMSFIKSPGNKASYWGPENPKIFLILYGITGYFFATKMARLIILMGPIASALRGIVLGSLMDWCIIQFLLLFSSVRREAIAAKPAKAAAEPPVTEVSPPKKAHRSKQGQESVAVLALVILLALRFYGSHFLSYRPSENRPGCTCHASGIIVIVILALSRCYCCCLSYFLYPTVTTLPRWCPAPASCTRLG
jgi:hypothetical protein